MSKEQLEEIMNDFRQLLALGHVNMDVLNSAAEIHELVKEQVEQKLIYDKHNYKLMKENAKIIEENKRYRKVIEETLQAMGMVDRQKYGKTLERALEGETE